MKSSATAVELQPSVQHWIWVSPHFVITTISWFWSEKIIIFVNALIWEKKNQCIFLKFLQKGRNCFPLIKNWTFESLWNHFEVLLHKMSQEFIILALHDFLIDPKITKFEDPLYFTKQNAIEFFGLTLLHNVLCLFFLNANLWC